jgi:hypothetical protein
MPDNGKPLEPIIRIVVGRVSLEERDRIVDAAHAFVAAIGRGVSLEYQFQHAAPIETIVVLNDGS